MSTIISLSIGVFFTWYFAKIYYEKAGRELKAEAQELKELNNIMLEGMKKAGWVNFERNADGKIINLDIHALLKGNLPTLRLNATMKAN